MFVALFSLDYVLDPWHVKIPLRSESLIHFYLYVVLTEFYVSFMNVPPIGPAVLALRSMGPLCATERMHALLKQ